MLRSKAARVGDGDEWFSLAAEAGGSAWIRCDSPTNEPYCYLDLTSGVDVAGVIADALRPSLAEESCRVSIPTTYTADNAPTNWHNIVPAIRGPAPDRVWAVDFDDGPA